MRSVLVAQFLLASPALAYDLHLCQPPALAAGATVVFEASGALPGEVVGLAVGPQIGSSCLPVLGGRCVELRRPKLLALAQADAQGVASFSVAVPGFVPPGATAAFQAVLLRGPGGADTVFSQPLEATTVANPIGQDCPTGNVCANIDADSDGVHDVCDICAAGDDLSDRDADGVPDACDVSLDNLVARWEFEGGSGADSSGNGHDIAQFNGPIPTGSPRGDGLFFDGAAWLDVAPSTDFDIQDAITLASWVRPAGFADYRTIVARTNPGGDVQDWGLYLLGTEVGVDVDFPVQETVRMSTGAGLLVDTWYHVAATWSVTSGAWSFYVNGEWVSDAGYAGPLPANLTQLSIGVDAGTPHFYFGGIDDVQVWSRQLSGQEVRGLYLTF